MKKYLNMLFVLLLALAVLAGCGSSSFKQNNGSADSEEPTEQAQETDNSLITVGFSQLGAESDWRSANSESMRSAFSEDKGYELLFEDGQQKQSKQITAIRSFIQQGVD